MNVLFIVPSLRLAGAERQVIDLANGLSGDKFNIHFFTFENELDQINFFDRTKVKFYNKPRRHKFNFSPVGEITRIIDRENIDIVHCTLQIALLFGFLGIRRSQRKPKLIDAVHTTININMKADLFDRLLYVPIMRRCDRIIAVCESQKEHWLKKYPFLSKKMVTIHNGIDTMHFTDDLGDEAKVKLLRELDIRDGELVVGMLAGFRPEKNHEEVFIAFSRLVRENLPVKLLLIGDGAKRQILMSKAKELGIDDRVIWAGFTNEAKKYISIIDVGVLFSYAVETFSMAILEMLAMGKPVVAADIGGTKEMIEDGINGCLVQPRDVDALTDKLCLLLRNSQLRERFSITARQTVLGNFTKELMVQKTDCLLRKLI
jgi:glycosyltransferase involved in cell wall biosynthesis